jgi:hypothetical protein
MGRYVLTADTTLDGLVFPRGSIVNAPHNLNSVVAEAPTLDTVPRARVAGLEYLPSHYIPVPLADQIGLQQSTNTFPPEPNNVIDEPVLPTENSQYD